MADKTIRINIKSDADLTIKSVELADVNAENQVATTTTTFTSIVTLNYDASSLILVISTLNAHILKFKYDVASNVAVKYDQIDLLESVYNVTSLVSVASAALNINLAVIDSSIDDTELSPAKRTLFVTYDRYLFKVNMQNCEQFDTCESCLGIRERQVVSNPFCGWCVYEQKCMLKQACSKKTILGKWIMIVRYPKKLKILPQKLQNFPK